MIASVIAGPGLNKADNCLMLRCFERLDHETVVVMLLISLVVIMTLLHLLPLVSPTEDIIQYHSSYNIFTIGSTWQHPLPPFFSQFLQSNALRKGKSWISHC